MGGPRRRWCLCSGPRPWAGRWGCWFYGRRTPSSLEKWCVCHCSPSPLRPRAGAFLLILSTQHISHHDTSMTPIPPHGMNEFWLCACVCVCALLLLSQLQLNPQTRAHCCLVTFPANTTRQASMQIDRPAPSAHSIIRLQLALRGEPVEPQRLSLISSSLPSSLTFTSSLSLFTRALLPFTPPL